MLSAVGTPTSNQLMPPSTVRASWPSLPIATAT
jgi:hypothetical protein